MGLHVWVGDSVWKVMGVGELRIQVLSIFG